jgi:hypothetical protein
MIFNLTSFLIGIGSILLLEGVWYYYYKKKKKSLYELKKLLLEASVDIRSGYKKVTELYEAIKKLEGDVGKNGN